MMPHIVTMANQILTINISADVSVNENPWGKPFCVRRKSAQGSEQCGFSQSLLPPLLKKLDLNEIIVLVCF